MGPKFGSNEPKSGPKLVFLSFFQVRFISFPRNYIDDSLKHCLTTSRGKTQEKKIGGRGGGGGGGGGGASWVES